MNSIDELQKWLDDLKSGKAVVSRLEDIFADISTKMADIVALMERDSAGEADEAKAEGKAMAEALIAGLQGLKFPAPQVTVNVSPTPITVTPAPVVIAPPEQRAPIAWRMSWVDTAGNQRTALFAPET